MKNKNFWENAFKNNLRSQRNFPNEELCRFLGRNYVNKKNVKILELGCGSGANVPAFLHFKMRVTAIDNSLTAIKLCKKKFNKTKLVKFIHLDMLDIDGLKDNYDVIVDVFSSYNLNLNQKNILLYKINRKLKKNGLFFSYTPSKKSFSWIKEKDRFDESTLNSFKRKSSPYYGNKGFFRFISEKEIKKKLIKNNFKINYCEKISKTYKNRKEYFEFLALQAKKIKHNKR